MTKDELAEIGCRLYGAEWKGKLAAELGRSRFTIYRWAAGKPMPEPAKVRIRQLDESRKQSRSDKP